MEPGRGWRSPSRVNAIPKSDTAAHTSSPKTCLVVANRAELTNWQVRESSRVRQVAFYMGLALIPVVVLGLLFWAARHT